LQTEGTPFFIVLQDIFKFLECLPLEQYLPLMIPDDGAACHYDFHISIILFRIIIGSGLTASVSLQIHP